MNHFDLRSSVVLLSMAAAIGCGRQTPPNATSQSAGSAAVLAAGQSLGVDQSQQVVIEVVGVYRKPDRDYVGEALEQILLEEGGSYQYAGSYNRVSFTVSPVSNLQSLPKKIPFGKVTSIEGRTIRVSYLESDHRPFLPRHEPRPGSFDARPADPLGPALEKYNDDWEAALRSIGATFRLNDQRQVVELKMPWLTTSDESLAHIRKVPALQKLDLAICRHVTDTGARHLSGLTELEELDLAGSGIGGTGLAHLAKLTKLKKLSLPLNGTEEGLRHLAGLTAMEKLRIGYGYPVTDEGLQHLKKMSNLTHLQLDGSGISDEGLAVIAGFRKMESLMLSPR